MKNLIPHFIYEKAKDHQDNGAFPAVTMFVDISGFTQMTEELMQGGDEGAEILSSILNTIFNPMVDAIYDTGGFIATFAGDAFTAIFPIAGAENQYGIHVLGCAEQIQHIFRDHGQRKTKFGTFHLKAKVGLSFGQVEWGIIGTDLKAYFFRGEAIDDCAASEHQTYTGEIVVDEPFAIRWCDPQKVETESVGNTHYRLLAVAHPAEKPPPTPLPPVTRDVLSLFLPDSVLDLNQMGEFRNAISVFISFEGISTHPELETFIAMLLHYTQTFAGYFNKIDFGDKGSVALCVFGAPVAYEKNIERALDFALSLKTDVTHHDKLKGLNIRFGITYGTVYAGIIGGEKRCEYTIIGDMVNLSARLMMKAPFGEIWVSEAIYHMTAGTHELEPAGTYTFKGKSEALPVYRLKSKQRYVSRTFTGKFVGRQQEMEQANTMFQPLFHQKFGGAGYIYGEAGVGKSRFVWELKHRYDTFKWLYLPCDGILKKPFNPFSHLFMEYFQQNPEHPLEQKRSHFEQIYHQLITSLDEQTAGGKPHVSYQMRQAVQKELIRLRSVIAGFLGITYPGSLYEQLEPKLRYENTLYAFKEIFKAMSLIQPVVLELEDSQWIDSDSTKALQVLCRNIEAFPIFLLIVSRYQDDGTPPKLPLDAKSSEIDLNTLSREGISELAADILQGQLSETLIENLHSQTQGNPFFIEQTLLYFREAEIIQMDSQRQIWEMVKAGESIPSTINDLLVARIDRLSDKLKEVVQTAAVLGREFEVTLLSAVLRNQEIEYQLKEGEKENIWSVLSELKYIFSHSLLQDTVYRMQLKNQLRSLHKLVAEAIETLFPNDSRYYGELAFHYEKADVRDKTIEYLHKAGNYADQTYENQRALEFFDKLLSIWDEQPEEARDAGEIKRYIEILLRKGKILQRIGNRQAEEATYQKSLELAQKLNNPTLIGRSIAQVGKLEYLKGNFEGALNQFETALSYLDPETDTTTIASVVGMIAAVYSYQNKTDEAIANFEKAIQLYQEEGDQKELASVIGNLGLIYWQMGDYKKAMDYYNQQLQLSERIGFKEGIAKAYVNIGTVHYKRGDYEQAMLNYERRRKLGEELGDKFGIAIALANMGNIYKDKGDYPNAASCFEQYMMLSEELGNQMGIFTGIGWMGDVYKAQHRYDDALNAYDRAIDLGTKLGVKYYLSSFLVEKAELLFLMGQYSAAKELNIKGLQISQEVRRRDRIFQSQVLAAQITHAEGQTEHALEQLQQLLAEPQPEDQKARLHYELWRLKQTDMDRQTALQLYQHLYEKTPKYDYHVKIKTLMSDKNIDTNRL